MMGRFQAVAFGLTLTGALVLTGCTIGPQESSEDENLTRGTSTVTLTSTLASQPSGNSPPITPESPQGQRQGGMPTDMDPTGVAGQLRVAVDQAVATHGGTAGIAISNGVSEVTAGDMTPAAAWSTIKVPIAIAALRMDPSQAPTVTAAIQWSDNSAAETLWAALGTPEQAGIATETVMAEGGGAVSVNTVVTRSPFSSFGQTLWAPNDQARFAANLPCVSGSDPVLENMGKVQSDQSWGIGQLPGARFKGGWGPKLDGTYSARQFGLTTDPATGQTRAVAIIVNPGSGTFADATSMANTLISTAQSAILQAPVTSC